MAKGKYDDWLTHEGLILIEAWSRDGLTEEQIAGKIGVSAGTLSKWKRLYPEILQALQKGRELVDREVELALLKRAIGYDYVEETREGGVVKKEVKKHVPPDLRALIFWLKNRQPEIWGDKEEKELKTNLDMNERAEEIKERLLGNEKTE